MKILSHPRSLAFGLVLLGAAFGFSGSIACAQAIEPSSMPPALETDGNANLVMRPDVLFCVTYDSGDETCISEMALLAAEQSELNAIEEVSPAELFSSATEIDSASLYWADAIKVAITERVTIAARGQEAENSESESTGSLPSDASAGELNNAPKLATPAQHGTD